MFASSPVTELESATLSHALFCQVHLKHAGMHKTPDILLTIPICVKGKAVHWIDSKVRPPLTPPQQQPLPSPNTFTRTAHSLPPAGYVLRRGALRAHVHPLPLKHQLVVGIVLIWSTGTRGSWAAMRLVMVPGV